MNQPLVKHKYIWLDLFRGLAAVEVFLSHLRALVFKSYGTEPSGIFKKAFYFFTGFAHQAVIVFFVLSGFFITDTIYRALDKGKFSPVGYGSDRLVRLWVVLIPGLILTFIIDAPGLHFFGSSPGYTGIHYMGDVEVSAHVTVANFIGNIFFLQGILVNTFGSNSPLWSLANEFWYYVLFPLVLFIFRKNSITVKGILIILIIAVLFFIGKNISLYFLIWLMGSVVVWLKRNFSAPSVPLRNAIIIFGILALVISLYKIRTGTSTETILDFIMAFFMGILVYGCLFMKEMPEFPAKIISFISGFSYSLYVIHLPLCIFLTAALGQTEQNWGIKSFMMYLLILILVLGVSVLFWFCFESRYVQVRALVRKKYLPQLAGLP
ncbi:MAG TPA: acyltransferase [Puia sp.]|nr:acyltransferase [Puia sp.]